MDIRYIDGGPCGMLSSPPFAAAGAFFRGTSLLSASRTMCESFLYNRQRSANYVQQKTVHPGCCDLSSSAGVRFSIDCLLTGQTARCIGPNHNTPSLDEVLKLRKFTSSAIDMCQDGRFNK